MTARQKTCSILAVTCTFRLCHEKCTLSISTKDKHGNKNMIFSQENVGHHQRILTGFVNVDSNERQYTIQIIEIGF